MRLAYFGDLAVNTSYVAWYLAKSGKFARIDHFTKPTLNITHVSLNPLPDAIIVKCDWEDNELAWSKRYSQEVPKIFVACNPCMRKVMDYSKIGMLYRLDEAIRRGDLMLDSLVQFIERSVSCQNETENGIDWDQF